MNALKNILNTESTVPGLSNIPHRPALGWLADRPWAHPIKIYITAMILGGAATMTLGFMTSFYALLTCALLFAISLGKYSYFSFISIRFKCEEIRRCVLFCTF